MKVHLMYRDRSFQPLPAWPWQHQELEEDLGLRVVVDAMAAGDEFVHKLAGPILRMSLEEVDAILYRQAILKDCLKNSEVVRQIFAIPFETAENKHKHWLGIFSSHPGGILREALELMGLFVIELKKLRKIADEHAREFQSEGFKNFFAMIQAELDDEYFRRVEDHISQLRFRRGILLSARLGEGNEGTDYILRRPNERPRGLLKRAAAKKPRTYSFTLHPRDQNGARTLSEIEDEGVNLAANAMAQSADHIDAFLNTLGLELAFYIGSMNLAERLQRLGQPYCFPVPKPTPEHKHSFEGLYDVSLALTLNRAVVGNDMAADGRNLIVITGANQGGKSTFLRSIGLAQLMMQCGMFVPAESFAANACTELFTHYKREEDTTMTSGKLDEELSRMSQIVDHIRPDAMLLLNESFAATNEREGSEIARQIITALLERRVKVFFVTHLYEFARVSFERNGGEAYFLRAERMPDGSRTFRLVEGPPLQTSFGIDVYDRIFADVAAEPSATQQAIRPTR